MISHKLAKLHYQILFTSQAIHCRFFLFHAWVFDDIMKFKILNIEYINFEVK